MQEKGDSNFGISKRPIPEGLSYDDARVFLIRLRQEKEGLLARLDNETRIEAEKLLAEKQRMSALQSKIAAEQTMSEQTRDEFAETYRNAQEIKATLSADEETLAVINEIAEIDQKILILMIFIERIKNG